MDLAAAVDKQTRGILASRIFGMDRNGTCILDVELGTLICCGKTCCCCIVRRLDRQIFFSEINIQRSSRICVRYGSVHLADPRPAGNWVGSRRRDRCILREHIVTVALADAAVDIWLIMCRIACDGGGELRCRLLGRRERGRRSVARIILVIAALRGGKRDVLVDGRCRKAFLELQLSGEFAVCSTCIEKLMCEGIQHILLVRGRYTGLIRSQCDEGIKRRLIDLHVAGIKYGWRSSVVCIVNVRMTAVAVDGQCAPINLVDRSGLVGIAAAGQRHEPAAQERIVHASEHRGGLIPVLVVPNGTVCKQETRSVCRFALLVDDAVQYGLCCCQREIDIAV